MMVVTLPSMDMLVVVDLLSLGMVHSVMQHQISNSLLSNINSKQ